MEARIIEVVNGMCWCKFLVARLGPDELEHPSLVDLGRPALGPLYSADLLVIDIETNEGALFCLTKRPQDALRKHRIWIGPLFGSFLTWLCEQLTAGVVLADLPGLVELEGGGGIRPEGPLDELLKKCLHSDDKEMRALARTVWQGTHEEGSMPLGTPPTLADLQRWVGEHPDRPIILP